MRPLPPPNISPPPSSALPLTSQTSSARPPPPTPALALQAQKSPIPPLQISTRTVLPLALTTWVTTLHRWTSLPTLQPLSSTTSLAAGQQAMLLAPATAPGARPHRPPPSPRPTALARTETAMDFTRTLNPISPTPFPLSPPPITLTTQRTRSTPSTRAVVTPPSTSAVTAPQAAARYRRSPRPTLCSAFQAALAAVSRQRTSSTAGMTCSWTDVARFPLLETTSSNHPLTTSLASLMAPIVPTVGILAAMGAVCTNARSWTVSFAVVGDSATWVPSPLTINLTTDIMVNTSSTISSTLTQPPISHCACPPSRTSLVCAYSSSNNPSRWVSTLWGT